MFVYFCFEVGVQKLCLSGSETISVGSETRFVGCRNSGFRNYFGRFQKLFGSGSEIVLHEFTTLRSPQVETFGPTWAGDCTEQEDIYIYISNKGGIATRSKRLVGWRSSRLDIRVVSPPGRSLPAPCPGRIPCNNLGHRCLPMRGPA